MVVTSRSLRRRSAAILTVVALGAAAGCSSAEPESQESAPEETGAPTSTPPETTSEPTSAPEPSPTQSPTDEPSDPPDDVEVTTAPPPAEPEPPLGQAGVSAGHPAAVDAATEILEQGGNAADAAIAAAFAVSVVEPFTSGIGGGGAAIVVPALGDGETAPVAYDYREVVAADGVIPDSGTGIPGFVAGMQELHEEYGVLDWEELIAPSIELAGEGHPLSPMTAEQLRLGHGPSVVEQNPQFGSNGEPLSAGDPLVQTELADTLSLLAAEGPEVFYTGSLADELTAVDGIDAGSLADFTVDRSEPVSGQVGDYRVLSAAPALAGVGLIQQLQVAEALGAGSLEQNSAPYLDALASAWQVADESMNTVVGDPAAVDVPVAELTDRTLNADLAAGLSGPPRSAAPGSAGTAASTPAGGNTSHVSVVDQDGMSVSMTNTIMRFWGSGETVGGFFLNDQLTRFDAIGTTSANSPGPGLRSVSWSSPTVLLDEQDRPVLVLGTPGGRQIPNILTGVIVQWALAGESLDDAVAAPRAHAEGELLRVEDPLGSATVGELEQAGYTVEVAPAEWHLFGSVQALEVDYSDGTVSGAPDDRRDGTFEVIDTQ